MPGVYGGLIAILLLVTSVIHPKVSVGDDATALAASSWYYQYFNGTDPTSTLYNPMPLLATEGVACGLASCALYMGGTVPIHFEAETVIITQSDGTITTASFNSWVGDLGLEERSGTYDERVCLRFRVLSCSIQVPDAHGVFMAF